LLHTVKWRPEVQEARTVVLVRHAEYECGKWWGRRPPRNAITNLLTLRGGPAMRPFVLKVLGWWHWKVG